MKQSPSTSRAAPMGGKAAVKSQEPAVSGQPENLILLLRGEKVILDAHLAVLYGVTTGNLNKAVKRHRDRFPEDFMFQLTPDEMRHLIFQFGISSLTHGGRRKPPFAFTEQGVAMLSSVLNSERARCGRRAGIEEGERNGVRYTGIAMRRHRGCRTRGRNT